jgi:polysaccharide biosynthesis PFTS motif protein
MNIKVIKKILDLITNILYIAYKKIFSKFLFCKNYKLTKIRLSMRGYLKLKKLNQLYIIDDLKRQLIVNKLNIPLTQYSKTIYGASLPKAEILLKKYLFIRILNNDFNKSLLISLARKSNKISIPIPKQFREIIKKEKFFVSNLKCQILWLLYLLAIYAYGFLLIFKILLESILYLFNKKFPTKKYVYFYQLKQNNLPSTSDNQQSYDIISWYWEKWNGRNKNAEVVHHSCRTSPEFDSKKIPLYYQKNFLPPLTNLFSFFNFLFWSLKILIIFILDFFRGRWWNIIMIPEAIYAAKARFLNYNILAKEYIFSNSNISHRPLWTYEAEAKGSKIILYFYSTNCEKIFTNSKKNKFINDYLLLNWPNYLVWDETQKNFLNKLQIKNKIDVVGPIWFAHSKVNNYYKNAITLFDVSVLRPAVYASYCNDFEYYIYSNIENFYNEIIKLAKTKNININIKVKRFDSDISKRYLNLINKLSKEPNIRVLEDVSVYDIVKNSKLVISLPFTSPTVVAQNLGVRCIFFDPSGLVDKNNSPNRKIFIAQSLEELKLWI